MTINAASSLNSATRPRTTLIVFSALHFAFFFCSLVSIPILAPGARIPNPFSVDDGGARAFFLTASTAIRVSDFLQLASGLCLAALTPLLSDTLSLSNKRSSSSWLTLTGGLGTAMMLSLSALCSWAIVSPGATDLGPALHVFQFLPFLLGGPGWAAFFAIFLAGISLGSREVLPRWLISTGLFLCCVSTLATLVLLTILVSPCLPIARFLGFVWLIVTTVYLARRPAMA